MRWNATLCAVALLVAGCSGEEEEPAEVPEDDFDEFGLDETADELGVIRGVVVDAAIQPLAGAIVSLNGSEETVTTRETGAFAFKDLQPGPYFVRVAKPGYRETQTNTEAQPGVKEPPVLRVMLEREPGTEPAIVPDSFQGHITCSIRIPGSGFVDGCLVFGNLGFGSTQRKAIGFEAGNILWIQGELDWTPSAQTADRLCSGITRNGEACGASPLVRALNQTRIQLDDLDKGETYEYTVYPDHLAGGASGNLVLEQAFELITHAFYNFRPPEDWQFGRDGLPPVPA